MKTKLYLTFLFIAVVFGANAQSTDTSQPTHDTAQVFTRVDVIPEFKGGISSLVKFIDKNLKYPAKAREDRLEGRVIVSFVVEKDGSLTDVKVVKSLSPETDAEALRIIALSPAWKPGTQGGKPVRVQLSMPIKFSLNND